MECAEIPLMSERDLGIDGLFEFLVETINCVYSFELIICHILSNNGVIKIRKVCIFVY